MSLQIISNQIIVLLIIITAFALLYYYRFYISLLLKIKSYKQRKDTPQKHIRETAPKECPTCGRNMEAGYLVGPRGIYWRTQMPSFSIFDQRISISGLEPLGFPNHYLSRSLKAQYFRAYRCQKCNIVHTKLNEQPLF